MIRGGFSTFNAARQSYFLAAARLRFARTFTETLLEYALGRSLEHYDAPVVRAISAGAVHLNYRDHTPMANLLMSLLDKAGVPTPEKIGDGTEHLHGV